MFISWKTDGTEGAVDTVRTHLTTWNDTDYQAMAAEKGRVNYKWEIIGEDLVITEEWTISRAAYDALNIDQGDGQGGPLPVVETTDHLTF